MQKKKKAFDKIQYPFMIKTLSKSGNERISLTYEKTSTKNLQFYSIVKECMFSQA